MASARPRACTTRHPAGALLTCLRRPIRARGLIYECGQICACAKPTALALSYWAILPGATSAGASSMSGCGRLLEDIAAFARHADQHFAAFVEHDKGLALGAHHSATEIDLILDRV